MNGGAFEIQSHFRNRAYKFYFIFIPFIIFYEEFFALSSFRSFRSHFVLHFKSGKHFIRSARIWNEFCPWQKHRNERKARRKNIISKNTFESERGKKANRIWSMRMFCHRVFLMKHNFYLFYFRFSFFLFRRLSILLSFIDRATRS